MWVRVLKSRRHKKTPVRNLGQEDSWTSSLCVKSFHHNEEVITVMLPCTSFFMSADSPGSYSVKVDIDYFSPV